jgi:hypothetical protein
VYKPKAKLVLVGGPSNRGQKAGVSLLPCTGSGKAEGLKQFEMLGSDNLGLKADKGLGLQGYNNTTRVAPETVDSRHLLGIDC